MVKVRVHKISSVSDPETSQPGKQIELVEVRDRSDSKVIGGGLGGTDEANLVKGIISQFQSIGMFPINAREMVLPKMTLFLSESEYDMLAIRFEVNDIFELILKDGAFMLKRATEGT
tara:strand:- start:234 stop:584 length:351 start_codon:yes stop_codon:yes gene_type:complete